MLMFRNPNPLDETENAGGKPEATGGQDLEFCCENISFMPGAVSIETRLR